MSKDMCVPCGEGLVNIRVGALIVKDGKILMVESSRGRRVYVVSSDILVQTDAWTHGGMRISSREFLAELSRTEQEIREHL